MRYTGINALQWTSKAYAHSTCCATAYVLAFWIKNLLEMYLLHCKYRSVECHDAATTMWMLLSLLQTVGSLCTASIKWSWWCHMCPNDMWTPKLWQILTVHLSIFFLLSSDALLHVKNAAKSTMNAGSSLDHLFLVSIRCNWIELICYIRLIQWLHYVYGNKCFDIYKIAALASCIALLNTNLHSSRRN